MAISLTVPDLGATNADVDAAFLSFGVSKQSDGEGGVVFMATTTVLLKDSLGNPYKTASYTSQLGSSAKSALRDFIVAQHWPAIKQQEGV